MRRLIAAFAMAATLVSANAAEPLRPTMLLVHGAFTDTSSWDGVTRILQAPRSPDHPSLHLRCGGRTW